MTVTLSIEIDEELHAAIQVFLSTHQTWDEPRVYQAMVSLFLMQNGVNMPVVNRLYLDSLFGCAT